MKPYFSTTDGRAVIYHGRAEDALTTLRCDLIVTDPPYGVGIDYGTHDDSPEAHWSWFLPILSMMCESAPNVVFTHRQAALKVITNYDWLAIWHKPLAFGHRIGRWIPHWEPIFVYGKPSEPIYDVFSENTIPNNTGHPCPKPIKLMRRLVAAFDDGVVVDPFCGSGTTLRAAMDLGRRAIGIEIEERYCEIAARRLEQQVLFVPEPERGPAGSQVGLFDGAAS